jgi:hypothetical protein
MIEQAEFSFDRAQLRTGGLILIGLGLACACVPLILPASDPVITIVCLAVAAAVAGVGAKLLTDRARTGVQVVVDRDGITDLRLMPDPIPWSEVDRIGLTRGVDRIPRLRLILRPDSALAAQRFSSGQVVINDLVLTDNIRGVRGAIRRLAPQVPRDW